MKAFTRIRANPWFDMKMIESIDGVREMHLIENSDNPGNFDQFIVFEKDANSFEEAFYDYVTKIREKSPDNKRIEQMVSFLIVREFTTEKPNFNFKYAVFITIVPGALTRVVESLGKFPSKIFLLMGQFDILFLADDSVSMDDIKDTISKLKNDQKVIGVATKYYEKKTKV